MKQIAPTNTWHSFSGDGGSKVQLKDVHPQEVSIIETNLTNEGKIKLSIRFGEELAALIGENWVADQTTKAFI